MEPLAIEALGMISSLGYSAEANAALMRCGYNLSRYTGFRHPRTGKPFLGAEIEDLAALRGTEKLLAMISRAVGEVLQQIPHRKERFHLPLIFCFPEEGRESYFLDDHFTSTLSKGFYNRFEGRGLSQEFLYARTGRTGFAYGLVKAASLIRSGEAAQALVVCADSLLSNLSLLHYLERSENYQRVNDEDNRLGFIPGEAAVALLLGKPTPEREQTWITGVGFGQEEVTLDSEQPLLGLGLTRAVREAIREADIGASANGEHYFFQETVLVASRVLETKRENWPLWQPAEFIGEVGAAVGGAMAVMAHYAFEKGYAPGNRALCQLSNDDTRRAAFVLERRTLP